MPSDEVLATLHDALSSAMPQLTSFLDLSGVVRMVVLDDAGHICYANQALARGLKVEREALAGRKFSDFLTAPDGVSLAGFMNGTDDVPDSGFLLNLVDADQSPHTLRARIAALGDRFLLIAEPLQDDNQALQEELIQLNNRLSVLARDNVRKGRKLAKTLADLQESVSQIRRLEGIIPICMFCKKIRDTKELWNRVEEYISEHSDATFSHGICPECFEAKYGDQPGKK